MPVLLDLELQALARRLALRQRRVEFGGSLRDALFEADVGFAQRLCRLFEQGDVLYRAVDLDDPAIGCAYRLAARGNPAA